MNMPDEIQKRAVAFVTESNRIEGIMRRPTKAEMGEFYRFMMLDVITVAELERFVAVYQPGAVLRDWPGRNVRVGTHRPPAGGPEIREKLAGLLAGLRRTPPWEMHARYEALHPFMDGNGRSGRMLWAWQTRDLSLGFLHRFYYQTLQAMQTKS